MSGPTQLNASLLIISVIAGILPAAFSFFVPGDTATEQQDILSVSRGVSLSSMCLDGRLTHL